MSTADGDIYAGRDRRLRLCREDAFGVPPANPDWRCVPIGSDGWTVRGERNWFRPDDARSGAAPDAALPGLLEPRGSLSAPACPGLAGFLLDAALDRPSPGELYSFCAELLTPVEARRYTGLTAASLTVSAAPDTARIALRFRGRAEEGGIDLAEDDFDCSNFAGTSFSLRRARLDLDGAELEAASGFTLRVDNDLRAGPNEENRTAYLLPGARTVTLSLAGLHGGAVLDRALRQGHGVGFSAELQHPAGSSMTIHLPRLLPRRTDESAPPDGMARRKARLVAVEDPEVGYDIHWSA